MVSPYRGGCVVSLGEMVIARRISRQ